jgi:hypothetical protein
VTAAYFSDLSSPSLSEPPIHEDDLGTLIADGARHLHEFTIENATDLSLRLLRAEALTPCCSSIGPIPESIPPGGTVRIPVVWATGIQSGARSVGFVIRTDGPRQPAKMLAMRASLIPAWEVEASERSVTLLPGRTGEIRFRVTARSQGARGRMLPEDVEATPPLLASYLGTATRSARADGLVESCREVLVKFPADREPGVHRGNLLFRWRGGRSEAHPLSWEVHRLVSVAPAVLALRSRAEPRQQSFLLSSNERPVRILGVEGPLLASPVALPRDTRTSHVVELTLDARRTDTRPSQIKFHTDHPDQPDVSMTVLVLPEPGGQDHAQQEVPGRVHTD